ncbi:hypothetical protein [Streptomyces aidingensis]|uniref:Arsenate reductase n=1 Tax=Streptomyces aidingensis TaxID=910347 RepID=A0A1I1U3K5_9ACTN|nr:hypothetical protein [Streptomyces aidingensis]SFD62450.1 hypothetical protein SAMN05421773_12150 [Streptomyces aidingensis]
MTSWTPDACTLPTAEQPLRVAEFDALFADAVQRVERPGDGRLRLVLDGAAEERARELAERETRCCSFFTFAFTSAREGEDTVVMEVTVPDEHAAVVEAMADRAEAVRSTS